MMKFSSILQYVLGVTILLSRNSWAQSGYNYARPDASNNAASNAGNSVIRPIVAAYPTGGGPTVSGAFPTAVTGFGAPISPSVTPTTPTAFNPSVLPSTVSGFPANRPGSTLSGRQLSGQRAGTGTNIFGTPGSEVNQARFGVNARGTTGTGSNNNLNFEADGDYSAVPGVPGVDYSIYSQVPQTSFDCAQQPLPGYYADVEAQCQVFHICALNRTYSFLCPNGTVFSQETLVCVWWNQYDCISAPNLYANNAFIYDYGIQGVPNNPASFGARTQQNSFSNPLSTSAGRPPTIPTGQTSNIFGTTTGSLRPTVTGNSYSGLTTPTTAFAAAGARTTQTRLTSTSSTSGQAFPTTSSVITPTSFGAVLRSGSGGGGSAGNDGGIVAGQNIGGQDNAYGNAQLATSSTNREYLPPRRP